MSVTIPNGIRTESAWIPFASIDVRQIHVTARNSTARQCRCRDLICGCSNSISLHAPDRNVREENACNEINGWSIWR